LYTALIIFSIPSCVGYIYLILDNQTNKKYQLEIDLLERIKGPFGHLSNLEPAVLIANNYHPNLKNVWLCHLSAENNLPDKAHDEVAAKLRENGIVPGEDVNIHVLMRKKVSGPWILK